MSYELIISEKPQAAQKIATALADKAVIKKRKNKPKLKSQKQSKTKKLRK